MTVSHRLPCLLLALAAAALPAVLFCRPSAAGQPPTLAARDAGARYGQALGVIEICHGSKLTDKANTLGASFQGGDKETFTTAAARVYEAWARVKACANQDDPNQCKIIMDKSCLAAESEIGATGTAMKGLVDFAPRN